MATITAPRVELVPYDRIRPDPSQPRRTFPEAQLWALARSIDSEGLLQPITLRPDAALPGRYIIVAGERRWRAIGLLGWPTIPAQVRTMDPLQVTKAQLLENAVRVDLNPVEEAQALSRALEHGLDLQELAAAVGMRPEQVRWRVDILRCIDPILSLVARRQLAMWAARSIARLSPDGQRRVLRALTTNALNTRAVQILCDRIHGEETQAEMFPETKLSAEQVRAVRTFGSAFDKVSRTLARIETMYEKNPHGLRQAFAAENGTLDARIGAAIKGLNRVRTMLVENRMEGMA